MTVQLAPNPCFRSWDNLGFPLVGGQLFTYAAGTSTPQATYTDSTQTTQNTNPIILNFRGEAFVWLDLTLAYKFILKDINGNLIWTEDNISSPFAASGNLAPTVTNTFTLGTPSFTWANAYFGPNAAPVFDPVSGNIGYYARTAAEIAAGVTPVNYAYAPGDSRRMAPDTSGVTDVTTKLQNLLDVAGIAALDGEVREVTLQPGTHKVTRLYMHYSNVFLRLMPGATIVQTLTGITNSNATGVAPAYAVIHINPLTYLSNPASGAAGQITNVKIYGGGTVQGPNVASPGSYQQYQLGIAANDCTDCWVDGILIQGCGGESLLMGNSSWFTNAGYKLTNCEITQGGEIGFNNARAALVADNYVHDVWFQNGLGIDGDNFIVRNNRIRSMPNSGMNFGGSGAHDVNACRAGLITGNVLSNTGQANTGAYAIFATDDGATTVPKYNIHICDNLIEGHTGPIAIAGDYNSGTVFVDNNTVVDCIYSGAGTEFNVIAGSAIWHLKANTFTPGTLGNYTFGITNGSTTASVYIEESNKIYGHPTADINFGAAIKNMGQIPLTLSGITGTPNTTVTWARSLMSISLRFSPVTGTSTSTSMGTSGLPSIACPAVSLLIPIGLEDNTLNVNGYMQITSSGVITFYPSVAYNAAGFTAAGTKGIPQPVCVSYPAN
jgi:hypothetical protein